MRGHGVRNPKYRAKMPFVNALTVRKRSRNGKVFLFGPALLAPKNSALSLALVGGRLARYTHSVRRNERSKRPGCDWLRPSRPCKRFPVQFVKVL